MNILIRQLTFIVFFVGGMIWAAFDDLLHVFGLHVDGHGAEDGARGRLFARLEAHWTRRRHTHEQLPQGH